MFIKKVSERCPIVPIRGTNGAFAIRNTRKGTNMGFFMGVLTTSRNYEKYGNPQKVNYSILTHDENGNEHTIDPPQGMLTQYINDGTLNVKQRQRMMKGKRSSKKSKRNFDNLFNLFSVEIDGIDSSLFISIN